MKRSKAFSVLRRGEQITPLSREETKVARQRGLVRLLSCARAHNVGLRHGFTRSAKLTCYETKSHCCGACRAHHYAVAMWTQSARRIVSRKRRSRKRGKIPV